MGIVHRPDGTPFYHTEDGLIMPGRRLPTIRFDKDAFAKAFSEPSLTPEEHRRVFDEKIAPLMLGYAETRSTQFADWMIQRHYRWWTVNASRRHVKLGPLALSWSALGFDLCVLCRWTLHRTIEGCWQVWK